MTAIRDPSGDQAGKVNWVPGPPSGVTALPVASIVRRWPSASIDGEPRDGGRSRGLAVDRGTVSGWTVTTPRPEMNARKTIDDDERKDDRDLDDPASATRADRRIRVRSLELDGFVHPPTIRDLADTGR